MSSLGPRLGFVSLVAMLVAFEVLFVTESRDAAEAVHAERSLREGRATEALELELVKRLDVGEARLEALETLPLLEEDGLLWVHDGVQLLPRVAGLVDGQVNDADLTTAEQVLRAWPRLTRREAAEACVRIQRSDPRNDAFTRACQHGLAAQLVSVTPSPTPSLQGAWLVVQRDADVHGVEVKLDEVLRDVSLQLHRRTTLEDGDSVALVPGHPLPSLRLISPRLDARLDAATRALTLKTVLLALTALLGLGVVWLARVAQRRKDETVQLQREFIATVSHELRTPLAAIRVMAETLERKLPTDGPAKDYPHRLVAAADGLTFLVDNILSFNRLEAGRLTAKRTTIPTATLQRWLEDDARLAVDTEVQVRCDGLDAVPTLNADPELLRVLVSNLLRNAWKYAVRRPVTFHLSVSREGNTTVLRFTDNGPGISPDAHERVFEAFHRLATATQAGGSGLGLALARRIAELHHGSLRVEASSPQGTTFRLTLGAADPRA